MWDWDLPPPKSRKYIQEFTMIELELRIKKLLKYEEWSDLKYLNVIFIRLRAFIRKNIRTNGNKKWQK